VKTIVAFGLVAIVLCVPAAHAGSVHLRTPLTSGEASRFVNHQEASHNVLPPAQLQALSVWLENHRSGWSGMVTPPSNERIELNLALKQSNGSDAWLVIVAKANGEHYLRITTSADWVYESAGGLIKNSAATRPLSDQDKTEIEKLTKLQ